MNYAVYFVAIGEPALRLLAHSYKTLRQAGFTGDLYILTDSSEVPFDVSSNTHVCKIRDEHLNLDLDSNRPLSFFDVRRLDKNSPRNFKSPRSTRKYAICHMKSLVNAFVPLQKYDYVVYLDSDVLTSGPIESFEEYLRKHNGMIITSQAENELRLGGRANFSFKKFRRAPTTVAANLKTWELIKYWFVKPLCADIICIPTDDRGKLFLEKWQRECQKGIDSDQAALQAVLLRYFKDEHFLAPYSLFGYGLSHRGYKKGEELERVKSIFIHFGGAIRDSRAFQEYEEKYL